MTISAMTNYIPRFRDLYYSPRMVDTYRAYLTMLQNAGIDTFCHFLLGNNFGWQNDAIAAWPMYTFQGQGWGRGDGSDGKADNRLCSALTKPPTVNQDYSNVSTQAQAWKDWAAALPKPNDPTGPGTDPESPSAPPRVRWFIPRSRRRRLLK
jgi:hypothetical protein